MCSNYEEYKEYRGCECWGPTFKSADSSNCIEKLNQGEKPNKHRQAEIALLYSMLGELTDIIGDLVDHVQLMQTYGEIDDANRLYGEHVRLLLLANPEKGTRICTEKECENLLENAEDYTAVEVVGEDELLVSFNPDDIIFLGGKRYIPGSIVVLEIDEDGNECSVNHRTINAFLEFESKNLSKIEVEDDIYLAYCLDSTAWERKD